MSNDSKLIKGIHDQVKQTKAGEGHVTLSGLYGDEKVTGVISVYDDQRPANEVLDDLYYWAEENDKELKERIEALSKLKD